MWGIWGGGPTFFLGGAEIPTKTHTSHASILEDSCVLREEDQERKSSPKSKFWGRISRRLPRRYPGGRPGAQTSARPSKSRKNKLFSADIHSPEARTSTTPGFSSRSEKLRAEFSFPRRCLALIRVFTGVNVKDQGKVTKHQGLRLPPDHLRRCCLEDSFLKDRQNVQNKREKDSQIIHSFLSH